MIKKTRHRLPILATDKVEEYPVLPLKTGVLFPGMMLTLQVGQPTNLKLLENRAGKEKEFIAAYSPSNRELSEVGVVAIVRDKRKVSGEVLHVTIEGIKRVSLDNITQEEPFIKATFNRLQSQVGLPKNINQRIDEIIELIKEIIRLDSTYSPELLNVIEMHKEDPSCFVDAVAANLRLPLQVTQSILENVNLKLRFDKLFDALSQEMKRTVIIHKIDSNALVSLENEQEKHFLRLKLLEIKKQLGDDYIEEKEASRIKNLIKQNSNLPDDVVSRAIIEADRLSQLSTASAEYGVTKNYLDWLLDLPWGKCSQETYDIGDVEKILNKLYFGPKSIKEQILQRLSVRKLLGGVNEGANLCLVGAHGTGKASLAKAIAKALGKEFIRISAGGINEVSELKGMPRTFLGAMPGKIIRTLRNYGSCDPVVLIEDIDYFNLENDSSVNMALLDVIDTRRNSRFLDNYLGVPFDLSKVFFICSVRSYEEIPEQFIEKLEILEFPGYIEREKIVIAKRYIIPNLLKKHGILKSELKYTEKILSKIINNYTLEAGLSGFSQQMEKIFRKIALQKAEKGKSTWRISEKNIDTFLGPSVFIPEKPDNQPEIGSAVGLAWTGSGGELMFIEGLKMKGDGQIFTTGSLGEVMRESIQAAFSYVRSKADMLGIDNNDFNEFDIHVHFPSGAVPKDGPSAGISICLVIASIMSERPIRNDVAMTGEITLRGKVLPVGGLKEKISAAYRSGIYHIAMPKENKKDLKELPKEIIRKTKFTFIERVDELFEICLLDFTPSAFTLEKVFAEEIAKAKKESRKIKKKTTTKSKVAQKRK
ncbi:MAG: endopeptidase La [candidate division Zixibacteria bacterium]|nr:endopeptidase La [candidate division Zixibacteria bacterium]